MAKKRKRAPGGGRKPNPNKKVMFSTRLEPHVMAALKAGAETWPQKNISTFAEHLINKGLQEREEEARDPALKALLHVVAQLAERFSGVRLVSEKGSHRLENPTRWRTDLFYFRAFKFAVRRLLDALEEPPENPAADKMRMKAAAARLEKSGKRIEWQKAFIKNYESPERFAKWEFVKLWMNATRTDPLTERQRETFRKYPEIGRLIEREFYGLSQAFRDLQLKPSSPTENAYD